MQAAFYESFGPASAVLQVRDIPEPEPGPGEVKVRVQWSGVNPTDVKFRAGLRTQVMPFPRIIPHHDGSGVIDAVGAARPAPTKWSSTRRSRSPNACSR
jgi:NADPH2:quinone reductase